MSLISSPISYPPSSSPPELAESRKRSHPVDHLAPSTKRLFGKQLYNSADPKAARPLLNTAPLDIEGSGRALLNAAASCAPGPFVDDDLENTRGTGSSTALDTFQPIPSNARLASQGTFRATPTNLPFPDRIRSTSGKTFSLLAKIKPDVTVYRQLIAQRSVTAPGKAKKSYYGIEIHKLIDESDALHKCKDSTRLLPACQPSIGIDPPGLKRRSRTMMWTEKYRARKFTDLVGDERTHRTVLRWLKGWDHIVFPGNSKRQIKVKASAEFAEDRPHRKILLLTGPPGLGKTTLAHVCAKQAGYEVLEINASDERSREIVKGRIRDSVGTENVRGVNMETSTGNVRKAGRPVCVIVDEVDGVVGGSSIGGEGGFIKALIDLVTLDQKNSNSIGSGARYAKKGGKGDHFRLLRPIMLICNDVYHPALRPLRASNMAEIIHIRKPPMDKVVARMENIFSKEGIANDKDGVRRLCELTWGISNRKEARSSSSGTGDGDIRGLLVVGEWVATKLRTAAPSSSTGPPKLTRQWVEKNMVDDLSHEGSASRGVGRGGAKEAVDRVFLDNAGFPRSAASIVPRDGANHTDIGTAAGLTDLNKGAAMSHLCDIINTCGEPDRIMTDVFAAYPSQPFQDDNFLSKPNAACDWLHFHDTLSSKVFAGQEWELNPYLSQSILGLHYLFASPVKHSWAGTKEQKQWGADDEEEPFAFSGPKADYEAFEVGKQNRSLLSELQSSLSPNMLRSFRSAEEIATDLLPHLVRILTPDVKPVIVGGSGEQRGTASVRREGERDMVRRSVEVMDAVGVVFERSKIEDARGGHGGYIYCMEP